MIIPCLGQDVFFFAEPSVERCNFSNFGCILHYSWRLQCVDAALHRRAEVKNPELYQNMHVLRVDWQHWIVGGVVSDLFGMRLRIQWCHGVTWEGDTLGQYVFLAVSRRCGGIRAYCGAWEDWNAS